MLKKGVDKFPEVCIINNCRCHRAERKQQNIRTANGECFKRKTLTSGVGSGKIIFADKQNKSKSTEKEFEKNEKSA